MIFLIHLHFKLIVVEDLTTTKRLGPEDTPFGLQSTLEVRIETLVSCRRCSRVKIMHVSQGQGEQLNWLHCSVRNTASSKYT